MADRSGVGDSPKESIPRPVIPPSLDPSTSLGALALRAAEDARRGGDAGRAAFEMLHTRLSPGLRRFFRARLAHAHAGELIEELTQRAWSGVWESLSAGRYDPSRAAFSTYVYAVASNIWLQHLRNRSSAAAREGGGDPDALHVFGDHDDPTRLADAAERLDALRKALTDPHPDLSETDRWIVRMSASGQGDRAIAAKLGIAASTLNERKQNAFSALRRILSAKGFRAD